MTTWFSATAVVPQLRLEWNLSDGAAAWLTIGVQLGFVVGALASSAFNVADVTSPRKVIVVGATGAALSNALLTVIDGAMPAIVLRFATGFFLAGVYPPALKLMATWFRRGRGTALGVIVGALTVGSATPHLVNGLGGLDWRVVVYATSALTFAGGLLARVAVPEGPFAFPRASFDPRQLPRAFRNRAVRLTSLGYFGHMWELYAMWAWFVVFFAEGVLRDPLHGAAPFAAFGVIAVGGLGCWVGGVLGDRWGRVETTVLMMVLSGCCAVAIGLLIRSATWIVIVVALVWGFAVVADSAQFSTLVTEESDQAYVGTALTMQLGLGFTLTVATIWLIPLLVDAVGWRWAFASLAPGPALGAIAMLRLRASRAAPRETTGPLR